MKKRVLIFFMVTCLLVSSGNVCYASGVGGGSFGGGLAGNVLGSTKERIDEIESVADSDEIIEKREITTDVIKIVQEKLNETGYECGNVDGISGKATQKAIISFMDSKGEESDGNIDDKLIELLEIKDEVEELYELQEYKADITYENLMRTPSDYIGEKVKYSGEVLQVILDEGNYMRLAIEGNIDNVVLCSYSRIDMEEVNILEGDYLTIYGKSMGTDDYISVIGKEIVIPSIMCERIEASYGIFKVARGF